MFEALFTLAYTPCIADIIHVANIVFLASYSVRDILWLRILVVVGTLMLMPYYATCDEHPHWEPIIWSCIFVLINGYQIFLLVKERWPRELHGLERKLYEGIFHGLTPGEFVKLVKQGSWRDVKPGETLVEDGSVVQHMMVLCEGAAEVRKGDNVVAELRPDQFVGEMSFLTGNKAGASVVATHDSKLLSWAQGDLERYLAKNGELAFKVRGVLGRDLVAKLSAHVKPAAQPAS